MDAIVKEVYFWALDWSKKEDLTLYGTMVYIRKNWFLPPELKWINKYINDRKKLYESVRKNKKI